MQCVGGSHLNDMFEPQDYPIRTQYPDGPPEAPYDNAGWTLPLQMGVRRVAVSEPFQCRGKKLDSITIPKGKIEDGASGYLVKAGSNDDYRLMNRLHEADISFSLVSSGEEWGKKTGTGIPTGSLYIQDGGKVRARASELIDGVSSKLVGVKQSQSKLKSIVQSAAKPRTGLYQPWTASMDEGWTRLVLDNFQFFYASVHNAEIRAGDLNDRYDCLILPSVGPESIIKGRAPDTTEPQYVGGIGSEGIVSLQNFVSEGGTLVCIDASCDLPIDHFNIPVRNILKDKKQDEFFCPGSILRVWVDNQHPVGYGMEEWISGYFARSRAFEIIKPEKGDKGGENNKNEKDDKGTKYKEDDPRNPYTRFPSKVVARYSDTILLESGWVHGGDLITDKPAIVEVSFGKGNIILLGFRVQNRAQPHGTFRLLFNAIQRSTLGE